MVWASTDQGLALIDPDLQVRALGEPQGVAIGQNWSNSGARTAAGELLFGGQGGLTVVRPGQVASFEEHPPVVVTEVRVGSRHLPASGFNVAASAPRLDIPAEDPKPDRRIRGPRFRGARPEPLQLQAAGLRRRVDLDRSRPPSGHLYEPAARRLRAAAARLRTRGAMAAQLARAADQGAAILVPDLLVKAGGGSRGPCHIGRDGAAANVLPAQAPTRTAATGRDAHRGAGATRRGIAQEPARARKAGLPGPADRAGQPSALQRAPAPGPGARPARHRQRDAAADRP